MALQNGRAHAGLLSRLCYACFVSWSSGSLGRLISVPPHACPFIDRKSQRSPISCKAGGPYWRTQPRRPSVGAARSGRRCEVSCGVRRVSSPMGHSGSRLRNDRLSWASRRTDGEPKMECSTRVLPQAGTCRHMSPHVGPFHYPKLTLFRTRSCSFLAHFFVRAWSLHSRVPACYRIDGFRPDLRC